MSICKQGKHFYYSFRLHGRRYHGACKECSTMRQARAYEKELKAEIEKAAMQEDAVRFRKCAMRKKSDNQEILLSAAIESALAEPTGKTPSTTQQKLKYSFWNDFCAFCHNQGITAMSEVTHIVAKNYFAYIREEYNKV